MAQASLPLDSLRSQAPVGAERPVRHRVVSQLPPWSGSAGPAVRIPRLRWRSRLVELAGLAVATALFAAAICALARIVYLAEEHRLDPRMLAALLAAGGAFTWLGRRIVLATADWLDRTRALSSPRTSPSLDSDPCRHPRTRGSRC